MRSLASVIKEILYGYIAQDSISDTANEQKAENYFLDFFAEQPYFKAHPDYIGAQPIENDPYGRAAVWAMVRGVGISDNNVPEMYPDTVVCIHHHDVVTVEDFKSLSPYAFSPDELEAQMKPICESFSREAYEDYTSGEWLFGRGGCDMKGGGSVQMALMASYAEEILAFENDKAAGHREGVPFKGNMIILSVPDEENLSAGMRAGVVLLKSLKDKLGFRYKLMINSEPHQRKDKNVGIFSFGSIGKVMPYVYVRGCLAHAGKVFEGLNPTHVMSEIVRRTEINMNFSDIVGNEAAPPPTWLYLRENKLSYDVSMPLTINGCLSVLTLNQSPSSVMAKLRCVCEEAFDDVIDRMNVNYRRFAEATHQDNKALPWQTKVVDFGELLEEARAGYGAAFDKAYADNMAVIREAISKGEESLIMANFKLVDFVYDYIDDLSPRVVIGLVPPYYPNVANRLSKQDEKIENLYTVLNGMTEEKWQQTYTQEDFYTGISDLSYSSLKDHKAIEESLKKNMPFFGDIYDLPLEEIEAIAMPGVNIGPWGKDFHKLTERVYKEDLYERTPQILDFAIKYVFGE